MKFATLVPRVPRRSYFRKSLFVILLVAAVMGGFGLYVPDVVGTEVRADTHSDLEMVASSEAEGLSSRMDGYTRTAQVLSAYKTVRADDPDVIDEALERERDTLSAEVMAIHYMNPSSRDIVCNTDGVTETKSVPALDLSWTTGSLMTADLDEVTVSEVYRYGGNERLALLSLVKGRDGVVMVVTDATKHAEMLSEPAEGSQTRAVTDTGVIAFDKHGENVFTTCRDGVATPALDAAVGGETGAIEREGDGDAGGDVVVYASVSGTNRAVLVEAPQTNVYAAAQVVKRGVATLIGVALAGLALVGVVIGHNAVLSLRRLRIRTEAFADGNLGVDLETRRVDGFGALTEAFAEVRDNLRERIETAEDVCRDPVHATESYRKTVDAAATGDLTVHTSVESDDEAVAAVGDGIDAMLSDFEATIGWVVSFAVTVDAVGERATAGTKEVSAASERIKTATADISEGAAEQASLLAEASAEMQDLSVMVEEVATPADKLADLVDDATKCGEAGRDASAAVHDGMANIGECVATATEGAEALREEVADIGKVVDLIEDVAEQTDLFVPSASIEVARAGEADSGLAAVVDEVRVLAEETADMTTDTELSIKSVEGTADETVAVVRAVRERVAQDSETVEAGVTVIDEAVDRPEEVDHGVAAVGGATILQVSVIQSVARLVDEAADIVDEMRDEAVDAAGAAHEQNDATVAVAGQMQELSPATNELRALVDWFEVRREGARDGIVDAVKLGDEDTEAALADGANPESRSSTTMADLVADGSGGDESIEGGSDPRERKAADDSLDGN